MAEHEEHKEEHGGGSHGGGGHGGGGHGGGGGHEEHEGAPEWLISFADNVALMMGFFVILLAMNLKEPTAGGIGGKEKNGGQPTDSMLDFVIAMRREFHNEIDLDSDNPAEEPYRRRIREKLEAGQSNQVDNPGSGRESSAKLPTDFSSLGGTIPFEDDSETLNDRTRDMALRIGAQVKGSRFIIEVRGHASPSEAALNVRNAIALAHKRAVTVAEQLVSQGVEWKQIRVTACGANETKTSRSESYDRDLDRMNQRVEVIVTGEPVQGAGDAQGLPKNGRAGSKDADEGAPSPHPKD